MPFQPVDRELDLPALDARVLRRWAVDDTFAESLRRREGAPEWVFYEGPPTANGRPGIHHVWGRLFKDLYPRFHTMRGKYVARKAGWDCHGLPVEVEVEKELGFSGKEQIEAYGIEAFNRKCRESVQRYVGDFEDLTRRIGMWVDTDDAYWTMSNDFIESVWWLFSQMWAKGDIEEGFKVVPYCAAVRHRALEPRARPARRVPGRHRGIGLRPIPRGRRRLRPPRLDDHPVDPAVEHRGRGRPRPRVRAGPTRAPEWWRHRP